MPQEKSLVIVDSDDSTRALLVNAGRTLGGRVAAESAEFQLGMKLARQFRPTVLVVEIAVDEEHVKALEHFHFEFPSTAILATCKDTSANAVLQAMRAGAKEFLPRPVPGDEAQKALERILRVAAGGAMSGGRIIAVFSNKGGTGTSTLAVNLAVSLAQTTGQGVALADFDNQAGEVSLFLNLRPTRTIADLVTGQGKIDSAMVQAALVKHPAGVYVLCQPERPEQTEGITGPRVHDILAHLTSSFPYVICDLSHSFNDVSLEVFDSARHILVVTLLNLPAIRSARRCLDVFRQLNYLRDEDKVRLVINRYLPNRDLDVAQLEETLGYPVFWKIPNDYATAIEAVNSGMPVHEVNAESEVARSYRHLAADLAGVAVAASDNSRPSAGLFGKLIGRKAR